MVSRKLGVASALELDGAAVCIQAGTTSELNLADYFRANGMSYEAITFDTSDQTRGGFDSGRCDVLTSDQSPVVRAAYRPQEPGRGHRPAGSDSPRNRWGRWCGRAMTPGSTSCAGRCWP